MPRPIALALLVVISLAAPAAARDTAPPPAPPQAAVATDERLFGAETFTLENGLQVVVVENHRVPVVSHMVWYKVGAADEPPGKSGIAHLLEHLMFKGTNRIGPNEFSTIVARHGGEQNAFTSSDYTGYYQNIAKEHLELVMGMEADRMANLRMTAEEVLTERDVVIEERLSRIENEPAALLGERLDLARWVTHPYRNPVIGWAHELRELDRQDALDFYKAWYAPNNAILVISGDVTAGEVRPLAERTYGQVPRGPEMTRARVRATLPAAAARIVMHHPRVAQPQWQRQFTAPSYGTVDESGTAQVYALQVLAELLGGGPTSRIYRALVVEKELAASAGAWYSARAVDHGTFGLYVTPRPGVDLAAAERAMEAEVARLLAEGVSDEEVEQAKLQMRAGVIYARDTLQGAAQTIGAALATGGTLDQVETWPARIAEVTRAQVMDAARAVLDDRGATTGVLLPAGPEQAAAATAR
ncbi:M16 family metallopeptidase [Novispirillum sp. DQ9]|uniref:M16 family metallopeptidase n=1 Tax=Novispirillum sp. DQ9 TaxID=3398612 RepID=UPI003C7AB2BA